MASCLRNPDLTLCLRSFDHLQVDLEALEKHQAALGDRGRFSEFV
jgi:hypothetical protein